MIGMTVCSGIGAPEVSAPWIDWRYQSEIDAFPSAVLAHRFPHAVNLGDMSKFKEWPDATVDVLCGGTPCQSFSVAGLRKGLDDPRGDLMLTYLAIARRYRPRWLVWENVPGVLSSSGGRDFGALLWGLGELGYGFAYRVLDAQYTRTRSFPRAVPQRRRRVFVVGYLGDWRRAAAVLFDGESLRGNPPPRRTAGEGSTYDIAPCLAASGCGFERTGDTRGQDCLVPSVANPLTARMHKGVNTTMDEGQTMVAHALRGEGFDASEDGTGRGTPLVPVAFAIQERAVSENPNAGPQGKGVQEGHAYTLEARNKVQAFAQNQRGELRTSDVSLQLTTGGGKPGEGYPAVMTPVPFDPNQVTSKANRSIPRGDVLHTLPATAAPPHLASPWAVRRLTPTECERLMGFPDGWTAIPYRNKPADACPDGPRYKALGNSWAVNCGEWVFDRVRMVEDRWP